MLRHLLSLFYWMCLCFLTGMFFLVAAQKPGSEVSMYAAFAGTATLTLAVRETMRDLQ